MRTSRANSTSFRLHHIGRTTSTRKSSQTFYNPDESFKLAALNSVTRGVKHADLSFMTGTNLNKLRVEPLEINEGQYTSAHDNLTDVRSRYDQMKKQRVLLQRKIENMKEQIGKFTIFKNDYEGKIGGGKTKSASLKVQLEEKKILVEDILIEKKVMQHMTWRHKTDKVFYDQGIFNLEKELQYRKKQLNIFLREGIQNNQVGDRTTKVYEKMAQELQRERLQREEHIRNIEAMIEEKMILLNANNERESDLVQIAERAIQDKDQNEKQWRKIFLTHIFVNKMLRNKIEKEMQKFRIVEFAFKEIKTATGIADGMTLVKKYLNKEAVYGELLSKIADNEKTIEQHKSETDKLNQEQKELQMEKEVLHSVKIKEADLHDDIKDMGNIEQKAVKAENYGKKMGMWAVRQLKKFNEKESSSVPENMNKLLSILKNEVDLFDPEQFLKNDRDELNHQKNVRVHPKKSRKNSAGEQIFDVEEEDAPHNANHEELELINAQHEAVLRENEKFMRELRRRKEEEKKLLIDKKEAKKAAPALSPQKKQEDD